MATETIITRESPEIEAYKLALMQQAKNLVSAPPTGGLPAIQAAGPTGLQTSAQNLAQQGVGTYQPFLTQAGQTIGQGLGAIGTGQGALISGLSNIYASGVDQTGAARGLVQGAGTGAMGQVTPAQAALQSVQRGVGREVTPAQAALQGVQRGVGREVAGAQGTIGGARQAYDPASAAAYMNPYQQAVADEINRAYDIQQNQAAGQAVSQGAFGGSRGLIAQQEIDRNRASALAQAQAQNFIQAQDAARSDFANQQARQMQAGQISGQLGLAGQRAIQDAAVAGGQLGLASQRAIQDAAVAGGQLGLAGLEQQRAAGMGLGQLGLAQQDALRQAGLGAGQLGASLGQLGQGIGSLGVQQAALGELGSKLRGDDISRLADLGERQRLINQAQLEAERQTQMQQVFEPYQRLGFYSDILRGAPTTQQTLTQSATANPSLLNQIVGGAATGLGLYGAASKGGLI